MFIFSYAVEQPIMIFFKYPQMLTYALEFIHV